MLMSSQREQLTATPIKLLGRPLNDVEEKFSPELLYVATKSGLPLPGPRAAIIGSRKATRRGLNVASDLAAFLAHRSVVIVSGLAEGIDTAAHLSAIQQKGGRTVAVIGTPLDKSYPAKNAELQSEIARNHWVVSQFPVGYHTQPKSFVIRNRTMALIGDASIIIEAGESSGSLHQGWEALRLGRPLFIWKDIFENASLKWPRKMQDYGAIELSDPQDVLEALPSSGRMLRVPA